MVPTLRAPISVEEYLGMNLDRECELVAGELRPKPTGTSEHSATQTELVFQLRNLFGKARTRVELTVRHGDDVLIPDVCVLASDSPHLYRGVLDEAPLLCVEVISPSQRPGELFAKCELYHEWGVPFCWVIDPVAKRAWSYHSGNLQPDEACGLLTGPAEIQLSELFS